MAYKTGFTKIQLMDYIAQIRKKPEDAGEILKVLFSAVDAYEPGLILTGPITRWIGQGQYLGATTAASYLSWVQKMEESPMRWVISSSIYNVMAAEAITILRAIGESRGLGILRSLIPRIQKLSDSAGTEDNDLLAVLDLLDVLLMEDCVSFMDSLEILDGVYRGRLKPQTVFQAFRIILTNAQFYLEGSGRQWYVTPGSVQSMNFEIRARLVILLLKKMILADDVVDAGELTALYKILGEKYAIPPEQAKWLFESAPEDFDLTSLTGDMVEMLDLAKRKEIFSALDEMAMADSHLDEREEALLVQIKTELKIEG